MPPRQWIATGERLRVMLILGLTLVAYGNSLVNGFAFDDNLYILSNDQVTRPSLTGFFEVTKFNNVFRPVTFGSFAFDWAVGGKHPLIYHILNNMLHIMVTLLLYIVLRKLLADIQRGPLIAWVTALIFAIHPIHTEVVSSITGGRSELLAMGFVLGAWLFHLEDRPVAGLLCFMIAMLAKESAIVFGPMVFLTDYSRNRLKAKARYAWIGGVTLVYLGALRYAQGGHFGEESVSFLDNPLAHLPADLRILNALRIAWKYVGLLLYPATLSCDYSYNAIAIYSKWKFGILALSATVVVVAVWVWALWTKRSAWAIAGTIYLVGFAVTANVFVPTGTIMGERLAYLPSAGFCLLVALLWEGLEGRSRKVAWVLLIVAVISMGARTMIRNRDWHDELALFQAGVKAVPGSAKMHSNLGDHYYYLGDSERAVLELKRALEILPDFPDALSYMGLIEAQKGNDQEAVRLMRTALSKTSRYSPTYDFIAVNLAAVEAKGGNDAEALRLLGDEIALWPRSSRAYSNRGAIWYRKGEFEQARSDAETALKLDPRNAQAAKLLAILKHSGQSAVPTSQQ